MNDFEPDERQPPATEYDLAMRARAQTVRAAAETLKAIADAKAGARSGSLARPVASPASGRGGDLLYELMQLQFAIGNRVAQLQGQYGGFGLRALERWYGALAQAPAESSVLRFQGLGKVTRAFALENRLGIEIEHAVLEWEPLRPPRPLLPVPGAITVSLEGAAGAIDATELRVAFGVRSGEPCIVRVEVDLERLRRAGRHQANLNVRMQDRERRIHLVAERMGSSESERVP